VTSGIVVRSRGSTKQALVPLDAAVSLVARATARTRFAELGFEDPTAEAMLERLEGVDVEVDEARLRASLLSTMVIDGIVRDFFVRHPDGVAVALHPGLCSRFSRVDDGALQWVDIDAPAIAALKCELLRTPDRHAVASVCGPCCRGWLDSIAAAEAPILFVHEGAATRAGDFVSQFDRIVHRAPRGAEYVLDFDVRLPLRASGREGASLELFTADGSALRYPRAKLVRPTEYGPALRDEVEGLNGVSQMLRGVGVPSVAHVRLV
jgi:O-methyltransferase involved in polyketide biosynthesis